MATFHIHSTFEVPAKGLFVMAGEVVEGIISAGMIVHLPMNSQASMAIPIDLIETAQTDCGRKMCLCIRGDEQERAFLKTINIFDEDVEVVNAPTTKKH